MSTALRSKATTFFALLALLALSLFASLPSAAGGEDAARPDADAAEGQFVAGVPRSLLAALAGLPEDAMGRGGLARVALAPDAEIPVLFGTGPVLSAVAAGELAVRLEGAVRIARAADGGWPRFEEVALRGDGVTLQAGDRVLIDAGVVYGLRSVGTAEAAALAAAILPADGAAPVPVGDDRLTLDTPLGVAMFLPAIHGSTAPTWPRGVTVEHLAAADLVAGPASAAP